MFSVTSAKGVPMDPEKKSRPTLRTQAFFFHFSLGDYTPPYIVGIYWGPYPLFKGLQQWGVKQNYS